MIYAGRGWKPTPAGGRHRLASGEGVAFERAGDGGGYLLLGSYRRDSVADRIEGSRSRCREVESWTHCGTNNAEQLSVGGAAVTGRRWQCVHRAGDRKLDWTKSPPAVGLL